MFKAVLKEVQSGNTEVLVAGLGISGLATLKYFIAKDVAPVCWDKSNFEDLSEESQVAVRNLEAAGGQVFLGGEIPILDRVSFALVSPGISPDSDIVKELKSREVLISTELELGLSLSELPSVMVTGTNGKSTTVSLIQQLFESAGIGAHLCGNFGSPVIDFIAKPVPKAEVLVVEASSYQLEWSSTLKPKVSVLLNLSEDHLERHGNLENYLKAKLRIFSNQDGADVAILPADQPELLECAEKLKSKVLQYGSGPAKQVKGAWYEDNCIVLDGSNRFDLSEFSLIGQHNLANLAAAILAVSNMGVSPESIQSSIPKLQPLEHRLEPIFRDSNLVAINDSKATTVASSVAALISVADAYPARSVTLLLGGVAKEGSWKPLVDIMKSSVSRLESIVCFGQSAEMLEGVCSEVGVPVLSTETIAEAVAVITGKNDGSIVLLSPGCASFDEFTNFEQRGSMFKSLVRGS